jgi:hypothetical protein
MKVKQTLKNIIILIALVAVPIFLFSSVPVSAVAATKAKCDSTKTTCTCTDNPNANVAAGADTSCKNNNCAVDTAILTCNNVGSGKSVTDNGAWSLLLTAINILTGLIVVAAIGGFVYAGILYTTSAGNADQTKKALEFIRNVVIGVVAYALMFATLNFIIPGGLFN